MTYFRRRGPTIIGADMFHGPVRKGKGWFHVAMVARRNGLYGAAVATTLMFGLNSGSGNRKKKFVGCTASNLGRLPLHSRL